MAQDEKTARATLVQTKYTDMLLALPHVMGVAVGLQQKHGVYTDEVCLVVMVDKKVPADQLDWQSMIGAELDGVCIDVQEIGVPRAY